MKTYSKLLASLFAMLLVVSIGACSDDDDVAAVYNPSTDEFNINRTETGVTFDQEAVILGVNGEDAKNVAISLIYLLPNINTEVTDNTKLLVVPELAEVYQKDIMKVYDNGGVIAVTDPSQTQLKQWFDLFNWDAGIVPDNVDDALMFSFGKGFHCCLVYGPDNKAVLLDSLSDDELLAKDTEDVSTKASAPTGNVVTQEEIPTRAEVESSSDDTEYIWIDFQNPKYPEVYNYLTPWVEALNNDFSNTGITDDEAQQVKQQFLQKTTRTSDSDKLQDVSQIFARYPYTVIAPFTANAEVRWLAGDSDPDIIKGTGAVTLCFNIYQIHCYQDQPGAGDYYLVNMTAGLASADMYKGKWWNQHSGTYVRVCGLYAKDFQVACIPYHQKKDGSNPRPYSADEVEVVGTPKPLTTVGQTRYDDSFTFSLDASLSVSGGKSMMMNKYVMVEPKISLGWEWTETTVRNISDTDIRNISGGTVIAGTIAWALAWKMQFNNLPEFDWGERRGFNEGNSLAYRSTNYLHANWVWHLENVSDDSTEDPIAIRVQTAATYGAQSFITTYADHEERTFRYGCTDQIINLKPFSRDKCGTITLENNFDKEAIMNVKVYKQEKQNNTYVDGDLVWSTNNTLKTGKKVTTPALKIADTYTVYLTTNDGKKYKYSNHPTLTIELGLDNVVYSKTDFSEVQQ